MKSNEEVLFPRAKGMAKGTLFAEIAEHPLMKGCREADPRYLLGLFGGFWPFVDQFPAVIEKGYAKIAADSSDLQLSSAQRRGIERMGRMLGGSEALAAMADDEREHRNLWLRSAGRADISLEDLVDFGVLPSAARLTGDMEESLGPVEMSMHFAAVEFVAEDISRVLMVPGKFRDLMGQEGSRWFNVHLMTAHHEGTAHEDIALAIAARFHAMLGNGKLTDENVAEMSIASGRRFILCADEIVSKIQ